MTGFKFYIASQITFRKAIEQGQIQHRKKLFKDYDPL